MCGITGFCSNKVDSVAVINDMNNCIIHRGPDAGDYYIDNNSGVVLGHRRLSIIDLSNNGSQPMTSANGRYVLVYNGEIYNAAYIKGKLLKEDNSLDLRGTSDTEVFLEAMVLWGVERACIEATGMFAFALYDKQTKIITLGRDRVGEKPLYYGYVHGDFVFASDLGAIYRYPGFDNSISIEAVREFLRYSYISAPRTIYENIYKLESGNIKVFKYPYTDGEELAYYDIKKEYIKGLVNPFKGSLEDATEELERRLIGSIKSQMISDVPLGAFLSAGIDSSTVVALMQDISDKPVKTFTIGFEEKQFNEANEAELIAKYLGTDHTTMMVSENNLIDVIPRLPEIFTEPFADSSQIPTYLVSKLARSQVTVSLSGDAGDELFGGYNTYWKFSNLYSKVSRMPFALRQIIGKLTRSNNNSTVFRVGNSLLCRDISSFADSIAYNDTSLRSASDSIESLLPDAQYAEELMLRDLMNYHPNDILVKVDRAGMAVSLENRVPMLDKEVLELAFSLPLEYKIIKEKNSLVTKRVLKEVLYKYVPKELMDRPKKGFSVPLQRWLSSGVVHDMAWDILVDSLLARAGILEQAWINQVMARFNKTGEAKSLLWNIFILEQWYRKYNR